MKHLIVTALAVFVLLGVSSAAGADALDVRLVSQTNSTITLGWTPQPGYGYLFSADGVVVSRTNDASRSTVKFAKGSSSYEVAVIVKGATGTYPPAPPPPAAAACADSLDNDGDGKVDYPADPGCSSLSDTDETDPAPPPPVAKITQTIGAGSTIANVNDWRAVYDANGDGVEDDPGSIEFLVDGAQVLSEINAPFGDTFANGSIVVADGTHTFLVRALNDSGTVLATNSVSATVSASAPPPPPPPPPPSGYPDASNTGVPAGTTLTVVSGGMTVSTSGAIVDSKDIRGCVTVNASNVTIKNSKTGCINAESGPGLIVQDTTVVCGTTGQTAVGKGILGGRIMVLRTNISGCEDGIYLIDSGATIRDTFIHDLMASATAHNDGIQVGGPGSNVTLEHNTVFAIDTSAIQYCNNTGCPTESNVLIRDNLLAGGGWTIYCPKNPTVNFQIVNNKFSTRFSAKIGSYGPSTDCEGEIWSGNVVYETGQPLSR